MNIEQPPSDLPKPLQEYLVRMFKVIDVELGKDKLLNPTTRYVDDLVKAGMLRYYPDPISGSPITSGGLWFRGKTGWTKVV